MSPRKAKTQRKARGAKRQITRNSPYRHTPAEKNLWKHLRDERLGGYHFERDSHIEGRVFPFFCRSAKLAIAIDRKVPRGSSERDYKSDTYLLARGIMVGHFAEEQILNAPSKVANQILVSCRNRTTVHPTAAMSPSMQTSPLGSNFRIAPNRPKRRAWIVGIAIVAILGGLIFIFGFGASFSPQGNTVAQKLLATLTPAPTRTLPGPSPTLVEMKFPTLSAERQSALAANAIFVQAEKELDSQPQSVIDLLLTRLPQFTSKSDLEDAYSYLGRAELVLHHYHAAAGYFKQLYALEPSPEYLYSLAVAYDLDGDWQNALTSYRALSESNGNNAAVYRVSAQQRAREIEQRLYAPAP